MPARAFVTDGSDPIQADGSIHELISGDVDAACVYTGVTATATCKQWIWLKQLNEPFFIVYLIVGLVYVVS